MRKLKKVAPTFYKYEDATDDWPPGFTAIPRDLYGTCEQPLITSSLETKHELEPDSNGKTIDQFRATEKKFRPIGNREPLAFKTDVSLHRRINGTFMLNDLHRLAKIGEETREPFTGEVRLLISAPDGDYDVPPSGMVWLHTADPKSRDQTGDVIFVTLILAPESMEALCHDLIVRPNAMLAMRLQFSMFQEDTEERFAQSFGLRTYLLEPDSHTPIVEARISVINPPERSMEGDVRAVDLPAATEVGVDEADISIENHLRQTNVDRVNLVEGPVASDRRIIDPPINLAPLAVRLNVAIALLTAVVLILLFK